MKHIDYNQIDSLLLLESGTDEEILDNLIRLYAEQCDELVNEMRAQLLIGKYFEVSNVAHKLKSSSYNLGLTRIGDICLEIETEGRRQTQLDYEALFLDIEARAKLGLVEIQNYIKAQKSGGLKK